MMVQNYKGDMGNHFDQKITSFVYFLAFEGHLGKNKWAK